MINGAAFPPVSMATGNRIAHRNSAARPSERQGRRQRGRVREKEREEKEKLSSGTVCIWERDGGREEQSQFQERRKTETSVKTWGKSTTLWDRMMNWDVTLAVDYSNNQAIDKKIAKQDILSRLNLYTDMFKLQQVFALPGSSLSKDTWQDDKIRC